MRAAPGALVELVTNLAGRGVGVNVEQSSWVTIEGFRSDNRSVAGFRSAESDHITFRVNVARDNGRWGIFTGCVDDVVIEGNLTSGSCEEHGIYVSNSGDRPRIAGNVVFDNNANGIHMNGDASIECTGTVITFSSTPPTRMVTSADMPGFNPSAYSSMAMVHW